MKNDNIKAIYKSLISLPAVLLLFSSVAFSASPLTSIQVNTILDVVNSGDNQCSLREAMLASLTKFPSGNRPKECPAGTINDQILIPAGHYIIAQHLPDMTAGLRLIGAEGGGTILDANQLNDYVLKANYLVNPLEHTSILENLTIQNSQSDNGAVRMLGSGRIIMKKVIIKDNYRGYQGSNRSKLDIFFSSFINNGSENPSSGAGILLSDRAEAQIVSSTFIHNKAENGAGIALHEGSSANILASTFYHNQAKGHGGAIFIKEDATLDLTSSTLVNNIADANADDVGDGGAISVDSDAAANVLFIQNNIIAGNIDSSPVAFKAPDIYIKQSIVLKSLGANFIGSNKGVYARFVLGSPLPPSVDDHTLSGVGDIVGTENGPFNPLLGPLQNNGGITQTLLPIHQTGRISPVIDAGECQAQPLDQRSDNAANNRIHDFADILNLSSACDIGAVEFTPKDFDESFCFPVKTQQSIAVICL